MVAWIDSSVASRTSSMCGYRLLDYDECNDPPTAGSAPSVSSAGACPQLGSGGQPPGESTIPRPAGESRHPPRHSYESPTFILLRGLPNGRDETAIQDANALLDRHQLDDPATAGSTPSVSQSMSNRASVSFS